VVIFYIPTQNVWHHPFKPVEIIDEQPVVQRLGLRPVNPLNPVKQVDGDYEEELFDDMVVASTDYRMNPVIIAENEYRLKNITNLIANGYAEVAFMKNLKLRVTGGINRMCNAAMLLITPKPGRGMPIRKRW
jgi:hypothetical protein